jgi:hypothetical protein
MKDMYIGSGLALDNSVLRRVFEYGEKIAEWWRKCRMKTIQLTEYYCGDFDCENPMRETRGIYGEVREA